MLFHCIYKGTPTLTFSYHIHQATQALFLAFILYFNLQEAIETKRNREMMNMKPGDWNCRSCQHLNFSRRESCQRCGDPRSVYTDFGGVRSSSSYGFMPGSDVRLGDWYCQCGTHNFASRSNCFKCNAFKDECAHVNCGGGFDVADIARLRGFAFGGAGRSGWKSGDWICTRFGCNEHNFASRHECFRCNAPRDYGTEL